MVTRHVGDDIGTTRNEVSARLSGNEDGKERVLALSNGIADSPTGFFDFL